MVKGTCDVRMLEVSLLGIICIAVIQVAIRMYDKAQRGGVYCTEKESQKRTSGNRV